MKIPPLLSRGGNFFIGKCDILYHIIDRIHKIKKQISFKICAFFGLFTAYTVFSVQINTKFEFHRHLSINMAKYIHRMHLSDGEMAMLHRERRKLMNSIDLHDLCIDAKATVGELFSLRGAFPTYEYSNGAATTTRNGTRYRVATPAGMLNIKVGGEQTVDFDKDDEPITVRFEKLSLYIYYRDGKPVIAGKADAIEVVDMES